MTIRPKYMGDHRPPLANPSSVLCMIFERVIGVGVNENAKYEDHAWKTCADERECDVLTKEDHDELPAKLEVSLFRED